MIERAAAMLRDAERPVFLIGAQVRWSPKRDAVKRAADAYAVPFYLNGMARGAIPYEHPGLFSRSRKAALAQADVAFVFGTPFDFRLDYGRSIDKAKIVQVDLDGAELGRNRRIDLGIDGDTGLVLDQLLTALPKKTAPEWLGPSAPTRPSAAPRCARRSRAANRRPIRCACARRSASASARATSSSVMAATSSRRRRTCSSSSGHRWMIRGRSGHSGWVPVTRWQRSSRGPTRDVVLVYGDGSFGLHAMEFEAMVRQKIPVVAVIGNDAGWTQIRRGQVEMYGPERAVATGLEYTRYEKVVEACGGFGAYVEKVEELGPALDAAFASKVAACVNVKIAKSDFRKGAISV